ncbi:MAG TPA: tetratricopeptide repeat protein [Leptolyngbyaceae cyanobacterium M33_DOE_097]|uniref:Tetratricopeptide repeat protein n=1 Tax=Oscillatoriales cyanobacterium SpSt-418 TaxID=2282169 RepID=A0A7C3PE44_9CYAN|nr:tetratricopeptide repeat protein [Leptolyngbyaceae cyanobacterium M33_DOE_097]
MATKSSFPSSKLVRQIVAPVLTVGSGLLLSVTLFLAPALAKDPFRTSNAREIGDRTEAAFRAVFQQGNYVDARKYLAQAEDAEPLAHAMRGAMLYIDYQAEKDKAKKAQMLEQLGGVSDTVRDRARQLLKKDPLRGNLYMAVSHFFKGGFIILRDGTVKGTPQGLSELQSAYRYLDEAEKIDAKDAELNLLRGYMDLLLAANLPFSSPDKAIERLDRYAGPEYLANRGLAMGYLALNQYDQAISSVEQALREVPQNPEVMYLKGQILYKQNKHQEAIDWFNKALNVQAQKPEGMLPPGMVRQITRERDRAQRKLAGAK